MSCNTYCGLQERLIQLESLIRNAKYKTPLTGFDYFLSKATHKLAQVTNYFVYNKSTGEEVHVSFQLLSDQSIRVQSNVDLINHILILS